MRKNILITGLPRSGKSTILKKIISSYQNKVGFITNEVLENGERAGFEAETHNGKKAMLASVKFNTNRKVSKYFVDTENLDLMLREITEFKKEDLLFLDEIGQMELFSEKFKEIAIKFLDSENLCITTLLKVYTDDFIEKIKNRNDIIIVEITQENTEIKQKLIENLIKKIIKAKKYASEPERFTIGNGKAAINTDHGVRHIISEEGKLICDCGFFQENRICSHVIALEEFLI
jgi:nucleoside-triphosphatase